MTVTIVDYGAGNLGSMRNMLLRIGVPVTMESNPEKIAKAEKLILPGVGAFDAVMQQIKSIPGLVDILERSVFGNKVPILGVCVGMQILTNGSDEGTSSGLGWIPGRAIRFPRKENLKVPHMGWNAAVPTVESHPLLTDLGDQSRFYFVHSYYVQVNRPSNSLMRSQYGLEFDSAIGSGNIMGVQFHPEKSHRFGMQLLKNFANL